MLENVQLSDFEPLLDQVFTIRFTPEVQLESRLVEARGVGGHSKVAGRPFTLVFRTDQHRQYYTQSTFEVEHPALGAMPIFLVPLGPGAGGEGMLYEANFA